MALPMRELSVSMMTRVLNEISDKWVRCEFGRFAVEDGKGAVWSARGLNWKF
jgi:hypothetical protein